MDMDFLSECLFDAAKGSAICFLGAGFSLGAINGRGTEVPSVATLCALICKMAEIENDGSNELAILAGYCRSSPTLHRELIELLQDQFTGCEPTEAQRQFLSLPWRSVFTTNFDDVAESTLRYKNPVVVTPRTQIQLLSPDSSFLYYLHGRALDLRYGFEDAALVIAEENYLKLSDRNRDLYAALENEVHIARRVFFVGYSLRDMQIASTLFSIENLKEKSVVICGPNEDELAMHRLQAFGTVYPIGMEGLSAMAKQSASDYAESDASTKTSFVHTIEPLGVSAEIKAEDVENLILAGKFSYTAYARQRTDAANFDDYCITRSEKIESVFDSSKTVSQRFVVTSDMGNGKTTFLEQLVFEAHSRGFEVHTVNSDIVEVYQELDALLSSEGRRIYLIDGYARHHRVANYIGGRLPATSILIVTAMGDLDEMSLANYTSELGGRARQIDLNTLTERELEGWDKLLERWGFWEELISDNEATRFRFLNEICNAENRSIILSIFENTRLGLKVERTVEYFLKNNAGLSRAFIAVLINAMCQNHVDWLDIDQERFRGLVQSSPIADLVTGSRKWYEFSSSALAQYIFSHYDFEVDDIVEVYTKIVRETAFSSNDLRSGFDSRENMKELMRFRFLTRLFSGHDDADNMIALVYERLSSVKKIRKSDQFWLQYAMARMEVGDLEMAETYINTAMGISDRKGVNWSNRQIVDQRVRLYFRKNAYPGKAANRQEVAQAIDDLDRLLKEKGESIIHPLRASHLILDFLEEKIDELLPEVRKKMLDLLTYMRTRVPADRRLEKSRKGETANIRQTIDSCLLILRNA